MALQQFTLGPKSALPDESIFDTVMSFRKLDDSGGASKNNGAIHKIRQHMEYMAEKQSIFLLRAFDLMYEQPQLALILGGSGLEQVNVLAKMLKAESDRLYTENLIKPAAGQILGSLGPLGMGNDVAITTRGPDGIVYSRFTNGRASGTADPVKTSSWFSSLIDKSWLSYFNTG